jgi:hypothetical protein
MQFGWVAVLIVTALGGGCKAMQSVSPLVDREHAVYDPELVGKWVSPQDEKTRVLNVEAGKEPETYTVTLSGVEDKSEYRAKLGRWGGDEFADVESLSAPHAQDSEAMKMLMPAHLLCRIRHDGDFLWLAYVDRDWAEKRHPEKKQREIGGKVMDLGFVFTASSEELQKFVLQYAHEDKAFREFRLVRQGSLAARAQTPAQVKFDDAEYQKPAGEGEPAFGTVVFHSGMKDVEFLGYSDSWFGIAPVEFSIPDASVKSMLYEKTSKWVWRLLLKKSKKHYLTIRYTDASGAGQSVTVRLDKRNYQRALAAAEAETGIKVERADEK